MTTTESFWSSWATKYKYQLGRHSALQKHLSGAGRTSHKQTSQLDSCKMTTTDYYIQNDYY